MKLLESWQIHEALKYAGGPYDDHYMEWLTRALNYFNLSNNSLHCQWSHGTNGSGEYESELETECLRPGRRSRRIGQPNHSCLPRVRISAADRASSVLQRPRG